MLAVKKPGGLFFLKYPLRVNKEGVSGASSDGYLCKLLWRHSR